VTRGGVRSYDVTLLKILIHINLKLTVMLTFGCEFATDYSEFLTEDVSSIAY